MKRANWKFNNIDLKAISKRKTKENHRTHISRNSVIVPIFLNKTFQVHNGKKNIEITVTEKMLGHKFGEFSFTRKNSKLKKK